MGRVASELAPPHGVVATVRRGVVGRAAAYRSQFPGIVITTAATGSAKGVSAAAAGVSGIGASDAYLSQVHFQPLPSQVAAIANQLIARIA
jgi:ABC-type phosphate transport system substrate-binding protein